MGHAPENTLASFAAALALGAPCVELDVRLVEGELLVFHDERLERTTNGRGLLHETPLAVLRSLDAGAGEHIPTLDEVMDLIDHRAGVNIELKGAATAQPVAACLRALRSRGWSDEKLLVSSFDVAQLQVLRDADTSVRIGMLHACLSDDMFDLAAHLRAYSMNLAERAVTQDWIARTRSKGLRSLVYTVDAPADIARLRDWGVDGVFSNFPERVMEHNTQVLAPGWPS